MPFIVTCLIVIAILLGVLLIIGMIRRADERTMHTLEEWHEEKAEAAERSLRAHRMAKGEEYVWRGE